MQIMINRGSQWRRWEPHIHTPGTILNDQFGGGDPWETYLTSIETSTPMIEAIAVTDYYVTDSYELVLEKKKEGRLPNVKLVFPNVELRLDVAAKTGFVNAHLLVSPEDEDHLEQLHRLLLRLQFQAFGDTFNCTREDLIRLGKRADGSITDDRAALSHGATQFKVSFTQLRTVLQSSDWARKNILVGVAGAAGDGTSGVRQAADATVRQEIEKFADIIFASSEAQRLFWFGKGVVTPEQLTERYGGCKPCLHGSDAHDQRTVGVPAQDRYSWIKGELEFDALRQACIVPEGRAFVGEQPPTSAMPSQVITEIAISEADWLEVNEIPLNCGLVAIIGARGSGKTALADMIAAGCDAIPEEAWNADDNRSPSFLARARPLIGDAATTLNWGGGAINTFALDGRDSNGHLSAPRARYLSQQFVEELCSSTGVSDGLISEIERVIFSAHDEDGRDGAIDFAELRDHRTRRFQQARTREVEAIAAISDRIASELEKERQVELLTAQVERKKGLIENYKSDLSKLAVKGTEAQVKRHAELGEVAQGLRSKIQSLGSQRRTFLAMQDEVQSLRSTKAPEMLREAQGRHAQSGLSPEQWDDFMLIYKGDVDESLSSYLAWVDGKISALSGPKIEISDPNCPLIEDGTDLGTLKLNTIAAEMGRLEALFSADKIVRDNYTALTKRIAQETSALQALEAKLNDAVGAEARRKDLQTERDTAYGLVFQAIINEQTALCDLYGPLMKRLAEAQGTLQKLGFSVRRIVDVEQWGAFAEENLLDRRKTGPFNGRGTLTSLISQTLAPVWTSGDATEVQAAMTKFISTYWKDLLAHAPFEPSQKDDFHAWSKRFAHWLFGTDHISVQYDLFYDSVDIRKLSPGTRGIVLLLLYLALDETDDRPLIIDQPEENLDPKSVFEELVPLFVAAKAKRQVIMVTHNANLVINTDADQIIVAEAGEHQPSGLPLIKYISGGLENLTIRTAVCNILEGGEDAFLERQRRLRVK
ncbi:TrlF family AAA-like ATPase [Phaeobacter inhibens]|uniref:TrlF family AAA-like ATPase n=1 Tax=Phaeobacter inhibens TaxID=221822 RepID=UPI0021A54C8E|nr:AAA family ATPase [Phaeobacter inhibens]UWR55519.1 AAA family ATPase [Phaeobacter inhibens]